MALQQEWANVYLNFIATQTNLIHTEMMNSALTIWGLSVDEMICPALYTLI